MLLVGYVWGPLLYLVRGFPAEVGGFFDTPFKPFMFFIQYNNFFILKRMLSGVKVGISGRFVDSWYAWN